MISLSTPAEKPVCLDHARRVRDRLANLILADYPEHVDLVESVIVQGTAAFDSKWKLQRSRIIVFDEELELREFIVHDLDRASRTVGAIEREEIRRQQIEGRGL